MSKRPLSSPDPDVSSPPRKQKTSLDLETELNNLDHTGHNHVTDNIFTTSPPSEASLIFFYAAFECPHMDPSKIKDLSDQWDQLLVPRQKVWDKCLSEGSYAPLRRLASLQVRPADAPAPPTWQEGPNEKAVQATYDAFSQDYLGPTSGVLLQVMDAYLATELDSYNLSLAIVQSSGMGKSRTVEAAAAERFCLPFNLREQLHPAQYTYPLPDVTVRDFLLEAEATDQATQLKYAIFLHVLFCHTAQELEKIQSSEPLAKTWQTQLRAGETARAVGPFRVTFYNQIVDSAKTIFSRERSPLLAGNDSTVSEKPQDDSHATASEPTQSTVSEKPQEDSDATASGKSQQVTKSHSAPRAKKQNRLSDWLESAKSSCLALSERVQARSLSELVQDRPAPVNEQKTVFFLSFDEAHGLTTPLTGRRTRFHNLGTVLNALNKVPMFTIFLSTNSDLQALAAPAHLNPSLRVLSPRQLLPPITEMPFDVFTQPPGPNFAPVSTLQRACDLDIVTRFGRPLWHALYKNNYDAGARSGVPVIQLAMKKLKPDNNDFRSNLACLSIRILLDFDSARETARKIESRLVRSYMRVVYAVPDHRQYMRTGTPSEPVLAEAAACRLAECKGGIQETGPQVLAEAFQMGHLARGERGEMIGRLLLTIAHDVVCDKLKPVNDLKYHRPIKVVDFLKRLITLGWHKDVFDAKPVGDPDGLSLRVAFQHAWIHFSHFALAGDYEVVKSDHLFKFGLRGTALQCRANQRDIDNILPMIFGENLEDAVLSKSNSAPFSCQIKNRDVTEDFLVSPTVTTGQDPCPHPTLTLVMELGSSKNKVYATPITIRTTRKSSKVYAKSYQIVLHGASAATYGVITSETRAFYQTLLAGADVIEDFPRRGITECVDALKNMKPDFVKKEPSLVWSGLLKNP